MVVTDQLYGELRGWERYRPAIAAAAITLGWPLLWAAGAGVIHAIGRVRAKEVRAKEVRLKADATYAQVLTCPWYASAVFALQAACAAPSITGARVAFRRRHQPSARIVPGDATFAAKPFGAIDIFALWWVALAAVGLGMLYRTRATLIARWLLGAYATGAAALALTQALRGGV